VSNQATIHALEQDMVSGLARFFPDATRVRIPIRLSHAAGNGNGSGNKDSGAYANGGTRAHESDNVFIQNTVIEFGTPREVLFMVNHPLEFADQVLIENKDGSRRAEASVVAVQYHPERTVVAARFLTRVPNWIMNS